MAPPLLPLRHYAPSHVTEDTPPDLLEGTMDLEVTLPNGQTVIMTVHRSTPMMDLLIQVTTTHRINPGGHVIQVISDNIFLSYKPSTPIGTLDTSAIKIVAKNALNEKAKSRKSNLQQQAIERNIRLKVNLPRNQLAVYRVRPKALVSEIFNMVCEDKSLDPEAHEIRHPVNVDERLRGSCSLSDYQLQEVCVVSSDFRPPPLSVTDLITMSSIAHPEDKKRRGIFGIFSRKAKSSTGDSSLSSGSAGERSVSPARSDESNEGQPSSQTHSPTSSSATLTNNNNKLETSVTTASTFSSQQNSFNSTYSSSSNITRPVSMISLNKNKKRQAPVPPQRVKRSTEGRILNEKVNTTKEISLSRNSSDSSGYHEQENRTSPISPSNSEVNNSEVSRSLPIITNVTSSSSSSVLSSKLGKRKAPPPPKASLKNGKGPSSIPESPEETENIEYLKDDSEPDGRETPSLVVDKSPSEAESFEDRNGDVKMNNSKDSHLIETNSEHLPVEVESDSKIFSSNCAEEAKDVEQDCLVEETEEFSSLDTSSLPRSNESMKNDKNRREAEVLESVESNGKSILEPPAVCIVDKSSSPSQTLVTSDIETQTQTVSLSSETSCASLEMMNPMNIQKPKRQKRKKVPEEFLRNSSLYEESKAINGISSLPSDTSNPLHLDKNFECVDKFNEGSREYEENTRMGEVKEGARECEELTDEVRKGAKYYEHTNGDENILVFAQTSGNTTQLFNGSQEDRVTKNVSDDNFSTDVDRTSKLSVVYVEDINEEESTTDPVTPPLERRPIFTSKVQLSASEDNMTPLSSGDSDQVDHRSVSITQIMTTEETSHQLTDISKDDVIAELRSTIESSDDSPDLQPRILNLKPKEKNEWHYGRPSDYNLILNFKKKNDTSCDSPFNRSGSISSYESIGNNSLRKSRSSTETSYESAPPPPPDTIPPFPLDSDSKTSSTVASRQSSFSDHDGANFVKPKVPAFSISTYQSRASKVSYDKKLTRSESLASFQELQGNEDGKPSETKLTRSDSQRNEIFRSDDMKLKSTSTTFLNQCSTDFIDRIASTSNVRPSLFKSQPRSFYENGSGVSKAEQNETIQFDISSSKEPITFNRPRTKVYSNLRKAKSTLDVRNEGRMPDGFQAIPDSGLANEYLRLQDDFMKWQDQLLQNQQLLHNRVAPIASNPPVMNSAGMVNNMVNQPPAPSAPNQPQRKPIEITIPIRLVDSDEESPEVEKFQTQSRGNTYQNVQRPAAQSNPPLSNSMRGAPSVSVDAWQERPSFVVKTQPVVIEPQLSRPFDGQPRMQTIFQSAPQEVVMKSSDINHTPQPSFQQRPQNNFNQQNGRANFQQNVPRSEFQQVPQSNFQQVPQSSFQPAPQSSFQPAPQSSFQPAPQSNFQQAPQSNFQRTRNEVQPVPQRSFQQGPQSRYQQPPQSTINQQPLEANFQQFSEPDSQIVTKSYPQYSSKPQTITTTPYQTTTTTHQPTTTTPYLNDKNDDGINARFSSVVTLSNDKNSQSAPQKDKVRSVVQLNNSDSPLVSQNSVPFLSKIISGAQSKNGPEQDRTGPFASSVATPYVAPISSRLVQQASQPNSSGGFRVSPPKVERVSPSRFERTSPPQVEQHYSPPPPKVEHYSPPLPFVELYSPPKVEQQYSPTKFDPQPSPPRHEPSPPFGDIKLRHVETRASPPNNVVTELPAPPPPPPPPPPSHTATGPPPPPPPPMSENDRRAATGKKILGAANVPQLDARTELMMAIRQFGGSGKLRKSAYPPPTLN